VARLESLEAPPDAAAPAAPPLPPLASTPLPTEEDPAADEDAVATAAALEDCTGFSCLPTTLIFHGDYWWYSMCLWSGDRVLELNSFWWRLRPDWLAAAVVSSRFQATPLGQSEKKDFYMKHFMLKD